MLIEITKFEDLDTRALMDLYRESNEENAEYFHPDMDKTEALALQEAGFLEFLRRDFFNGVNRYYVLEEGSVWVSALRLTPVREGFYYLEALETHPDYRKRGYGARVLSETLRSLEKSGPFEVHDRVNKKNTASLATHRKCGFVVDSEVGMDYLTGERNDRSYGMRYCFK